MRIVFIGAGRLATNLSMALRRSGHEIVQVYSRTEKSAKELAHKTVAEPLTKINRIIGDADLYILSVTDDAIDEVMNQFPHKNVFMVHTAGSVSMDVLHDRTNDYGVFYPLQTFSMKGGNVDFADIPICIEANTEENLKTLEQLAGELSNRVHHMDSVQRLYLHVAAVFACNFSNFMFASAEKIMQKHHISFNILEPLIKETVDKALRESPCKSQTGPAARGDKETMEKHLNLLAVNEELQNLYRFVSDMIKEQYCESENQQGK
jgi:predicted short-subunit dehydrogenase-like oxidoreductase (DUF2520 family)